MLGHVVAIALFMLVHTGFATAQQGFPARIALVIGNGDYPDADRLVNPVNDARDIGAALGSVGFDTDVQVNVDQRDFGRAIDRFIAKLRSNPGALALFYFAGHGTQRRGGVQTTCFGQHAKNRKIPNHRRSGLTWCSRVCMMQGRLRKW